MPEHTIEMLWDCSFCSTRRIGGTKDHCTNCGAAHDTKKDPWYMPGDISRGNRITEPEKLAMAAAGPNWTCEHCGGTQRAPDGSCLNCAGPKSDAQADRVAGRPPEEPPLASPSPRRAAPTPTHPVPPLPRSTPVHEVEPDWPPRKNDGGIKIIGGAIVAGALLIGLLWFLFHKRPVDIEVTSVEWTQTVTVERYKLVSESGWDENMPSDAANVVNEGSRIHHYDKVLDHYDTVHYTVQVSDGEDCVDIPETCYTTPVTCSTNDNGTADCSGGDEVCSGGGQSCTPRYRDESRTRQDPVYRDEPRYEDHFAWTVWRWRPEREPSHSGETTQTSWPNAQELCLNCKVGVGEKEREAGRRGVYAVHFIDRERSDTFDYKPTSESEFHRFSIGSTHSALYSIAGGLDFQIAAP